MKVPEAGRCFAFLIAVGEEAADQEKLPPTNFGIRGLEQRKLRDFTRGAHDKYFLKKRARASRA